MILRCQRLLIRRNKTQQDTEEFITFIQNHARKAKSLAQFSDSWWSWRQMNFLIVSVNGQENCEIFERSWSTNILCALRLLSIWSLPVPNNTWLAKWWASRPFAHATRVQNRSDGGLTVYSQFSLQVTASLVCW